MQSHADPRRVKPAAKHDPIAIELWRWLVRHLAEAPLGKSDLSGIRCVPALFVALLTISVYVSMIVWLDNTNVGTTNGLWKSVSISRWAHETGLPIDSGELLYPATYGRLTRLIPDSLLRYGTPASDLTFRKMAILDGIFGGLASGLVFLLARRIGSPRWTALGIVVLHAGAGFVLLNSLNSEDIIPAYTFFLAATVCFFEYLYAGGILWFASSSLLLALATLFHWTVMVPALASFGAIFAVLLPKGRRYFALGAGWLFLFLCWVQGLVLLAYPRRLIPVWAAVLPEKAGAGGWVGLTHAKLWFTTVGVGNYFSGAANVSDYRIPYDNPSLLRMMEISWTVLGLALLACIATLVWKRGSPGAKLLAVGALALFAAGEAGALYSQPQDPQMQIQPMLVVVEGLLLLAALVKWNRAMGVVLLLAGAANGYWNMHLLAQGRGGDSRAVAGIREIQQLFPRTMIVCQGFEAWDSWHFVMQSASFEDYTQQNVFLTKPFVEQRGISAAEAASTVEKQIDGVLATGGRVVADAVWTDPLEQSASSFDTVTEHATARAFLEILKERYRMGTRWETRNGTFVELLPLHPAGKPL